MSQGGRDTRAARKAEKRAKREGRDLELSQVVAFLRVIGAMTGALLLVSVLFFLIGEKTEGGSAVYTLTIIINAAACAGSLAGARLLDRKDRELEKKEIEKKAIHKELPKKEDTQS